MQLHSLCERNIPPHKHHTKINLHR